ncbi:MAG TPA: hypothetical protein VK187_05390 [Geobacteraceae bacterium]|nr:hypothetical protein [Geobacteraceae bacterium]
MISQCKFSYGIGLAALIIFLVSGIGWGAEPGSGVSTEPESTTISDGGDEPILLEQQEPPPVKEEAHTLIDAFSGYRFISVNRYGGRAAEYEYLHSNPVLYGLLNHLAKDTRVSLEGGYLNDKDYHGELSYDYKGVYRFKLWTESLFHNLDHLQLFNPPFTLNSVPYQPIDLTPGDIYGLRVEQDLAQFRYKPERFPLHLNLGYWRMVREGTDQMLFADHAFEGTPDPANPGTFLPNRVFSKSRTIDSQTHEGQFGADAHMGYFDLIYEFRAREFSDHTGAPRDGFIDRLNSKEAMPRFGGLLEHSDTPDSRFYSHKIGLHTSMSGGLVGAVSYTFGKMENRSNLTDVIGADQTYNITHNIASDLSYTPCSYFSVALKYRRYEIERNSPAIVVYAPAVTPQVGVRPGIDSQKDTIIATFTYRPITLITVKGEYRGEFLNRDNLDSWVEPGRVATLSYPEHSTTHTGSLALLSRPLKGVRIKAQYLYSNADNPVYASAYEEKHEGSFQFTYNAANMWGVTASTRISRENNDQATVTTIVPDPTVPVTSSNTTTYPMPNDRKLSSATMSFWFVPLKKVTVTGSYGLLRSSSDKAVLFAGPLAGSNALTNYTQQSQLFSVNSVYQFDDRLDLSLLLQQVRSYAEFDPQLFSLGTGSTSGIGQISQLKTVESSLAARVDYRWTKNFSSAVEYSFRDYDEKNSFLFDGSVNTVMVYLAAKW